MSTLLERESFRHPDELAHTGIVDAIDHLPSPSFRGDETAPLEAREMVRHPALWRSGYLHQLGNCPFTGEKRLEYAKPSRVAENPKVAGPGLQLRFGLQ
jgi:hypothetical protein